MARINTNVSSMIAQSNLRQTNSDLSVRLQRLSTGLRINRGSDDPAGLIVSERLRSEMKGLTQACLLYTSPSPRDGLLSRMPSSA